MASPYFRKLSMFVLILVALVFFGGIASTVLASLHLHLFAMAAFTANPIWGLVIKLILFLLATMGSVAFVTLVLMPLRGKDKFITKEFFQQTIAALFSGTFVGLILLLLSKLRLT